MSPSTYSLTLSPIDRFRQKADNSYIGRVERCVEESLESVYNNEQGSTIRFTKHNPAHDNLRKELFAQLETSATEEVTMRTTDSSLHGWMFNDHVYVND